MTEIMAAPQVARRAHRTPRCLAYISQNALAKRLMLMGSITQENFVSQTCANIVPVKERNDKEAGRTQHQGMEPSTVETIAKPL
ncbi:MAG: hypothetical protein IIA61_07210 [Candidatus Marinimicrobia bacterium]|nr:hypothetical protein [Candidatus Neomarinimicrobiota bacterium]